MKRRFGSCFYTRKSSPDEVSQKCWNIPRIAGTALKRSCMVIGAIVLFSIVMGIISASFFGGKKSLPKDMVLIVNLSDPVVETRLRASLTNPLGGGGMTVRGFTDMLDAAGRDSRVRGLLLSLDTGAMELAHIQEVRNAVKRFRSGGKFAHIYTASFSDLRSGTGAYYFASAFDEIWMQPAGLVSLTGLSLEMPFAKEALDKIGVNPQFLQREEYKSAMESFTNTHMTPASREAMQAVLDDYSRQIFEDIAMERQIKNDVLQAQFNQGLITGDDALKAGLLTHIGYADQLIDTVRERITGNKDSETPALVLAEDYASVMLDRRQPKQAQVALVRVSGQIVPGSRDEPGLAYGDTIAAAIMEAADRGDVKVIVVRVDSPGGSPSASETIRRSIVYAKEEGKKVIVSMGPVAASGGYWLAVDADKIYALPTTLTGSIGVVMGKFELSGLWDKLGVNWDGIRWGENADLWSMTKPLTASNRAALEAAIDSTYADFLSRVAAGRDMDRAAVRDIAKGRVWTGNQARANGLIDELGGLETVLEYASLQAGIPQGHRVRVVELPQPLSAFQELMRLMGSQVSIGSVLPFLKSVEPELRSINALKEMGPVQVYAHDLPRVRH